MLQLVDHFCRGSRRRVDEFFRGLRDNDDARGYKLAQAMLGDSATWMMDGIATDRRLAMDAEAQKNEQGPQRVAS